MTNEEIEEFMKIRLEEGLPEPETLDAAVRRAPKREAKLSLGDKSWRSRMRSVIFRKNITENWRRNFIRSWRREGKFMVTVSARTA